MGISQFLILQIIAHLFTDFFLQTDKQADEKNNLGFSSSFLKWHILIAFLFSWILSFQINFIFGAIIISATHFVIDGLKKQLNNHSKLGKASFFIDQMSHLIVIIFVVILFEKYCEIQLIFDIKINLKYLLIFTGYLICLKPSNIFVKEVFKAFDITISQDNGLPNAGKLIGILERFLVFTFIILNQFEVVGFLIAAKSILRYKDDATLKTEYVLIGTMLSFGIAVALGIIINLL